MEKPRTSKTEKEKKEKHRMDAEFAHGYDDGAVDAFTAFYAGIIPPGAC